VIAETGSAQKTDVIIVAEDSAPNRMVLTLLLQRIGFEVVECDDGEGAWKALEETRLAGRPVVAVFSDLMMPKMDGLQLLRRVRNDEIFKSLPFVLITAVSDKDYIHEAQRLQVDGYLLKPITYPRIDAKLRQLFPHREFPSLAS
jgi:CheY-like chemotaxis protein